MKYIQCDNDENQLLQCKMTVRYFEQVNKHQKQKM